MNILARPLVADWRRPYIGACRRCGRTILERMDWVLGRLGVYHTACAVADGGAR